MKTQSPRKILVIKLRSLGDTVLMTAPLRELRAAYPEAQIHAAVIREWAPLLESGASLDRVWPYEWHRDRASRAKAIARLALRLRKERYDCVVNFHASPSSAMLAFSTGARIRSVHFHGYKDKNRYSTVVVPGKGTLKPIIERDMDAVRALGIHVPAGRLPQLPLQAIERQQGAERIARLRLPAPVLAIGLGSSRPTKSWPIERFAALAVSWCQRTGGGAVAVIAANEAEQGHHFLKAVDDALVSVPAEGRAGIRAQIACETGLPLRQLASLIGGAAVFAGNDSGPKHVAVAVGTPTVTLFGPEHPFEWHPYPPETHPYLFIDNLPCRRDAAPGLPAWCGLQTCAEEQHRCMRQIGVEEVLVQCERVGRK